MLLVNIHQLDIIFAQPVTLSILKHQIDHIRGVLCLESQDILILGTSQHFHEGAQVNAKGDVAVAAEGREGFGFQHHGDEGDMGVVHGLQGDARVVAVEVAVLDQVFDGIDDLEVIVSY